MKNKIKVKIKKIYWKLFSKIIIENNIDDFILFLEEAIKNEKKEGGFTCGPYYFFYLSKYKLPKNNCGGYMIDSDKLKYDFISQMEYDLLELKNKRRELKLNKLLDE